LSDQFTEFLRTPFAGGNLEVHRARTLMDGELKAELLGISQHTWYFVTAASFRI